VPKSKSKQTKLLFRRDVVFIEKGLVLADLRVVAIKSADLMVDNSVISGDPEPIPRHVNNSTQEVLETTNGLFQVEMTTENYLATENLMFYGTTVVEGEGMGVVVRTGTFLFIRLHVPSSNSLSGNGTLLARMIKDNESSKGRKEGGPKAKKETMKQLAKFGITFREPQAGLWRYFPTLLCSLLNFMPALRFGRVTTLVVDSLGVITERKSSVNYVMFDNDIHESSLLPEGEPSLNALLRACILTCNAVFQVPEGTNKTKLKVETLDVEEWDNTRLLDHLA